MGDRVILHSDINCCYASIEHLHHPELAGKPLAVGGDPEARHGIVLTADYIAKKYGVKTGMALWQAKQVCPDITFVSPRMDLYLRFSRMAHPLSVEMIFDVDKSKVVGAHLIESPVLGPISPKDLSGGVKTLMLMAFDENDRVFNASVCGDNCAKWILQIAENKDLTINLRHIMDFGEGKFEAKVLNTNQIVHNMQEFLAIAGEYV